MSHGNLRSTCHCSLYEWWGPARYLSPSRVLTMEPCKVPVVKPWTNHGALQGTCHWDLYEPYSPARYLSPSLPLTIQPCKIPVTETCMNHGVPQNRYTRTGSTFLIMQMDHDGGSLSLCLFAQLHSSVWRWPGFHSQTDFFHHRHVQTNQLTNQPTRPTFCTTWIYRIFTKLTIAGWSRRYICIYKTWQFISTLTKPYTLPTYQARWIQSTAWILFQ
jgi:hypothetical protein